MAEAEAEFQYSSPAHQNATSIAGMWLFLATEVLFFGAIFAAWLLCRYAQPAGFAEAARSTNLTLGSINTALLVSSSLAFTLGLSEAKRGDARRLRYACAATFLLGLAFLVLKGVEWGDDFAQHLWPGGGFALADGRGARQFYVLYFISTGLHAVHMLVGLALVAWVAWRSRRTTDPVTVEIVGLYWSFVDIVWVILYPVIYLWGRG